MTVANGARLRIFSAALSAASGESNRPKTAPPLPDIWATSAPESSSNPLRRRISGNCPIATAARSFTRCSIAIFRALEPAGWSGAAPDEHLEAIVRGDIAIEHLVNDLAAVANAQYPESRRLKGLLEDSGALVAQMSGSGGAVFGLFDSTEAAESAATKIRKRAPFATVIATTTLDSESEADTP